MPSLKDYNRKLASLNNMRKITKTMKMVSATKFTRALDAQRRAIQYATRVDDVVSRLAADGDLASHPLAVPRPRPARALVLVVSSDRGLCGGFNNHLYRFVSAWLATHRSRFTKVDLSFCGRRGVAFFKHRAPVLKHYEGITAKPNYAATAEIGKELRELFLAGTYDEIHIAYNEFRSAMSQKPVLRRLLPLEARGLPEEKAGLNADYLFEPRREVLLDWMLPNLIDYRLYFALIENAAGEHGARMTAMDSATTNAAKVIEHTTLLRNRARQATITNELIEIVSGAEALK